jgi:hypothetical protein
LNQGHDVQDLEIKYNKEVEAIGEKLSELRDRQRLILAQMQGDELSL